MADKLMDRRTFMAVAGGVVVGAGLRAAFGDKFDAVVDRADELVAARAVVERVEAGDFGYDRVGELEDVVEARDRIVAGLESYPGIRRGGFVVVSGQAARFGGKGINNNDWLFDLGSLYKLPVAYKAFEDGLLRSDDSEAMLKMSDERATAELIMKMKNLHGRTETERVVEICNGYGIRMDSSRLPLRAEMADYALWFLGSSPLPTPLTGPMKVDGGDYEWNYAVGPVMMEGMPEGINGYMKLGLVENGIDFTHSYTIWWGDGQGRQVAVIGFASGKRLGTHAFMLWAAACARNLAITGTREGGVFTLKGNAAEVGWEAIFESEKKQVAG